MLKKLFTLLLLLSPILAFSGCGDDDDNLEMVEVKSSTIDYRKRGLFVKQINERDAVKLWFADMVSIWLDVYHYHNGSGESKYREFIEMSNGKAYVSTKTGNGKKLFDYQLKQEPSGVCHIFISNSAIEYMPNGEYVSEK